jgi:hypothetical protein
MLKTSDSIENALFFKIHYHRLKEMKEIKNASKQFAVYFKLIKLLTCFRYSYVYDCLFQSF